MKVVMNMMRSILILIAIITISEACSSSAPPRPVIKPIVHTINFQCSIKHSSKFSSDRFEDMKFPTFYLLDYKDYTETFEKFCEMYPKITLDTSGVATSDIPVFSDLGKEKFGQLTFSTNDFNAYGRGRYRSIVLVNRYDMSNDDLVAKIKVGFAKKDTNLYLGPYLYASIYNPRQEEFLHLALNINTITFHQ